jgi:biuret amidohydrolase
MPYTFDRIDPSKTAMIVVDMQNDFVAEGAPLQSKQALAMADELAQTLTFCRENGIRVIYTAHVHREDGSDMGMYDDLYPPIDQRAALVDGTTGADIHPVLTPCTG